MKAPGNDNFDLCCRHQGTQICPRDGGLFNKADLRFFQVKSGQALEASRAAWLGRLSYSQNATRGRKGRYDR